MEAPSILDGLTLSPVVIGLVIGLMTVYVYSFVAASFSSRSRGNQKDDVDQYGKCSSATSKTVKVEFNERTIVDILKWRSQQHPQKVLYTFLDDNGVELASMTFGEVDQAARRIANALTNDYHVKKGDRIILCYPPGLDFSVGFWGCLYAGAIAIPVYPPYPGTLSKDLPKFNKMVKDSGSTVVLTNRTYHLASKMATLKGYFGSNGVTWPENIKWLSTDSITTSIPSFIPSSISSSIPSFNGGNAYHDVPAKLDDIAFFQYSSGSTSEPKAVMISYRNIRAQLMTWETISPENTMISWLPSYHDMGLVGFTIVPAFTACRCVSMSPISFIKDPSIWLRATTKYCGTHLCAPNFGYALAAKKVTDKQLETLDLRCVQQAICAAEPIREEALASFAERFQSTGFSSNSFNCGYGLAETTLVCSGQDPLVPSRPTVLKLDKLKLESEKIASDCLPSGQGDEICTLVGCGKPAPTFTLKIVNPTDNTELNENQVGEIWVSGESVASGYWGRKEQTVHSFGAVIQSNKGEQQSSSSSSSSNATKKYLRTGDLGFLRNGELYVTGRMKDLIIIRGRNVLPQDVELSVEQAHGSVRPGCVAAFSLEKKGEERLGVAVDLRAVENEEKLEEITLAIQQRILSDHQLSCYAIALLQPRSIPKTTSGKVQRHAAQQGFLDGTLKTQRIFTYDSILIQKNGLQKKTTEVKKTLTQEKLLRQKEEEMSSDGLRKAKEIESWLVSRLVSHQPAGEAEHAESMEMEITADTPWASLGMDSIALVSLSAELGDWLKVVVPPAAFFQFPTPHELAFAPGLAEGKLQLHNNTQMLNNTETYDDIPPSFYDIHSFPEYVALRNQIEQLKSAGLDVPYLEILDEKKSRMLNYNTYNYLGLAGSAEVVAASKAAIDKYGTSMSSSPIVGQNQLNVDLENQLCKFFGGEASVLFVGGWVTNVSIISSLVGPKDLILADALNHNSCVVGQKLSGATVLPFPHNDWVQADRILSEVRKNYRRVLIVVEGVYSMDGDIPDLKKFVEIKKRHKTILFVDEAHSFGTMGATGRGICEHLDVSSDDIDIRMGTMSKALGSTGGFILASQALVDYFKFCAGGFVFSVGLTPSNAGSTLQSLKMMEREPERVRQLQRLSTYFHKKALAAGLDLCSSFPGGPVIVVIVGSTLATVMISQKLSLEGINVKPIVYPAVEEGKCRLRFFLSSVLTEKEIDKTIVSLVKLL